MKKVVNLFCSVEDNILVSIRGDITGERSITNQIAENGFSRHIKGFPTGKKVNVLVG